MKLLTADTRFLDGATFTLDMCNTKPVNITTNITANIGTAVFVLDDDTREQIKAAVVAAMSAANPLEADGTDKQQEQRETGQGN